MRQVLLLTALLAWVGTASAAGPVWAGPGWYQVEFSNAEGRYRLLTGPFAGRDACESGLPEDEDEAEYHCDNFLKKPSGSRWWGPDFPGT